jgi:hypothetical protein
MRGVYRSPVVAIPAARTLRSTSASSLRTEATTLRTNQPAANPMITAQAAAKTVIIRFTLILRGTHNGKAMAGRNLHDSRRPQIALPGTRMRLSPLYRPPPGPDYEGPAPAARLSRICRPI